MDVPEHRKWMYQRTGRDGITDVFVKGVEEFVAYACQLPSYLNGGKIRCPCVKCRCKRFADPEFVKYHLYKHGFKDNYGYWTSHGEIAPTSQSSQPEQSNDQDTCHEYNGVHCNQYEAMVMDAAGPSLRENLEDTVDDPPNADAQSFYDMLNSAQTSLWGECSAHHTDETELSVAVQMLSIKADCNISEEGYNRYLQLMRKIVPSDNRLPLDLYRTKKMVAKLGLGYTKIDCCTNGCMLYYKDDENLSQCKFCESSRYTTRRSSRGRYRQVSTKKM